MLLPGLIGVFQFLGAISFVAAQAPEQYAWPRTEGRLVEYQARQHDLEHQIRLAREMHASKREMELQIALGVVHLNLDHISEGGAALNEARRIARELNDPVSEIQALRHMGWVYGGGSRGEGAQRVNREMLEVARRSGSKAAMAKAEDLVGRYYEGLSDFETALEYGRRALQIARESGDRELIWKHSNNTGTFAMAAGELDEAYGYFQEALSIQNWFGTRVNLAVIHLKRGQLEEALRQIPDASPNHPLIAEYHLRKGNYETAKTMFELALKDQKSGGSWILGAQIALGLIEEHLGAYELAAIHFRAAISIIDGLREETPADMRKFNLRAGGDNLLSHLEAYEGLTRLANRIGGGSDRESFYRAEFTRGRALAETLAGKYRRPDALLRDAQLIGEEEKIAASLADFRQREDAAFRVRDMALYRTYQGSISLWESKQAALVAKLREHYPEYAAVRYPTPVYPEQIPLKPGEVLLEFEVMARLTRLFVVKDGRIVYVHDAPIARAELSDLVQNYRGQFSRVATSEDLAAYDPRAGLKIFELLLKPAFEASVAGAPVISPESRLIIVPDEVLGTIPFEALPMSIPERRQAPSNSAGSVPVGIRYLGDDYDVAYAQSATSLAVQRRLKADKTPSKDLLVVADPIFGASDSRIRPNIAATEADTRSVKTMGAIARTMGLGGARGGVRQAKTVGREDTVFPRLDKTGLLAQALTTKLFPGARALSLVGREASKSNLLRQDLSAFRYLVFATHGVLSDMVPGLRESALILNQIGNPKGQDGLFRMSDVMALSLNADLVALTACQTGAGKYLIGEGVMGLGRAFQYAGARNVLVSLWNVAEDSTTMLTERFFFHLKQGKPRRRALRLARADIRRAGFEHPYYWSPFILITD